MNGLIRLLSILVLIAFATNVNGQVDSTHTDIADLTLEQLYNVKIVSASKTVLEASQAPASVMVITEEQIQIRGYRSLLDVLVDMPDIKIDDKAYSLSRTRITMRGIEGQEKLIIMLDGVRISSPTNESLPIMENYPVHLAKQIEIIYGPASALYGADAFAGIINIITKKAEYRTSKSEASYSMGDHGLLNGSLFTSHKLSKDVVLTMGGQYFYDQGINMSREYREDPLWDITSHKTGTFNTIYGPMIPSTPVSEKYEAPMKAYNIYVGLHAGEFDFSFFRNYSENSSAIENNPSNAVYNKNVFYGRGVSAISAKHSKTLKKISFNTTISASQYQINPNSNYRNMYSGLEPAYKYSYGSMRRVEEQLEWRMNEKTNIVGGVAFENFFSLPESTDLQDPVTDNKTVEGIFLNTRSYYKPEGLAAKFYAVKYFNFGAYMQWQQKVSAKFSLIAGVRFDHNTRFGSTLIPRTGVVMNPTKSTTLKVMAGIAYLAPTPGTGYSYYGTFYTLDSGRTYRSNFLHLPNPKLKPMISRNMEISLQQYIGKNFNFALTGYCAHVTNMINFAPDDGNTNLYGGKFLGWDVDYIEVFVNQGLEEAIGGSLQLAYHYNFHKGWLRAYSNFSFVDGTETILGTTRKSELDNISPWMIKSGIDISWRDFYMSPRLILLSEQRLEGESNDDARQTLPGYSLLNISLGYKLDKFSFFANVTNALNQVYRATGPNMDLSNSNTELFHGNYQDPIRFNSGIKVSF